MGMETAVLALHGFALTHAMEWALAGTSGHTDRGWLLLARGRDPVVRVGWRRHTIKPVINRTLDNIGQELGRCVQRRIAVRTTLGEHQCAGAWDGDAGTWHGAVRWFPGEGLTLTALGLVPALPVEELLTTAAAWSEDAAWRWCCYGLDLGLPPWWRLAGIQQFAGLTRAVWQRHIRRRFRPDQVLALRRLACASRLLKGGGLEGWVRQGLDRREQVLGLTTRDGVLRLDAERPAADWWGRWRGRRDRHVLHAWVEESEDRLLLREWRGTGEEPAIQAGVKDWVGVSA